MNTFAVAVLLQKHDERGRLVTTQTMSVQPAINPEEAKGKAVDYALKSKDGFGVVDLICLDLGDPASALQTVVESINTQLVEHGIDMQFDPTAFIQQ